MYAEFTYELNIYVMLFAKYLDSVNTLESNNPVLLRAEILRLLLASINKTDFIDIKNRGQCGKLGCLQKKVVIWLQ